MKRLLLGTVLTVAIAQVITLQAAQASASDGLCDQASGYCLSLGGMTNADGSIIYATSFATPLSKTLISTSDTAYIGVPKGSDQVSVITKDTSIVLGTLSQKMDSSTYLYGLNLAPGASLTSKVTRSGVRVSCSPTALGIFERYKTPVVEVTSVASDGRSQITFTSVADNGPSSESVLGGFLCKGQSSAVEWQD